MKMATDALSYLPPSCSVTLSNNSRRTMTMNKTLVPDRSIATSHEEFRITSTLRTPPNNFRSIPILPSYADIFNPCTFLRSNIVKGRYRDTEHYLDVQFRLLREDCIKPLRDGILQYLELKRQGKSVKNCKDVKVHEDVRIVDQSFVNGRLVYKAFFDGTSFQRIRWRSSKRLLPGSLLCMSSDGFQTLEFVTVAHRDLTELSNGFLAIYFEELTEANIHPARSFVAIESSSYFEAYRHNLQALCDLTEDTLPLKRYIIEAKQSVQIPQYLNTSSVYDMRPLLLPPGSAKISDESSSSLSTQFRNLSLRQRGFAHDELDILCAKERVPATVYRKSQSVRVLHDLSWPSAKEFNMDDTQYAALKAAVTKEFAVIQGPPGTGKTFVGLRITQLLLHNIKNWNSGKSQLPIMVVCQTNHALDQFLEGILCFTKKIVRVGGSGKNKAILKYQLNNLKKDKRTRRRSRSHFSVVVQQYSELVRLGKSIVEIQNCMNSAFHSIVNEKELRPFMSSEHYYDFFNCNHLCGKRWCSCLMKKWLAISVTDISTDTELIDSGTTSPAESDIEESLYHTDDEWYSSEEDVAEEFDFDTDFTGVSLKPPSIEKVTPFSEKSNQLKEKLLREHIQMKLRNIPAMSENEADTISSVWEFTIDERWSLYKFWTEKYIQAKKTESLKLQKKSRTDAKTLGELRTIEDKNVCERAHVVGMTTTGAAKYRQLVQYLNPVVLMVEEAAELLESHVVTSLAARTQHVILIGDHQQLRPNPSVHLLAVKYGMNISLFERMVENGLQCYRLGIQHRMRKEISALLVPHIYRDLKDDDSVFLYESIKGVSKSVFFVNQTNQESYRPDSKSKFNTREAKFILSLCRYLLLQGYQSSQITVLTTYSAQLSELRRLRSEELQKVHFTVVDNYQGEENDIILISFVRSNLRNEIGFLKISNRVCVALSRAKKGLFCIGDFSLFASTSDLWKNITQQLCRGKAIGTALELTCQNHPNVITLVSSEEDFDAVPNGGCSRKCQFRLPCSHLCVLMCHPYDTEHKKLKCPQPCTKCCPEKHPCRKKCFEKCGPCNVTMKMKFKKCQHTVDVLCSRLAGVKKGKYTVDCEEMVEVQAKGCGHKVLTECGISEDVTLCHECKIRAVRNAGGLLRNGRGGYW